MEITNDNFLNNAETAIRQLKNLKDFKGRTKKMLTTSKIRNLLSMSAEIYTDVVTQNNELNTDTVAKINYLKIRFLYEAGRESSVKDFVDCTHILDVIDSINSSKENYILFNKYLEALVAYHKFYGGKDN